MKLLSIYKVLMIVLLLQQSVLTQESKKDLNPAKRNIPSKQSPPVGDEKIDKNGIDNMT